MTNESLRSSFLDSLLWLTAKTDLLSISSFSVPHCYHKYSTFCSGLSLLIDSSSFCCDFLDGQLWTLMTMWQSFSALWVLLELLNYTLLGMRDHMPLRSRCTQSQLTLSLWYVFTVLTVLYGRNTYIWPLSVSLFPSALHFWDCSDPVCETIRSF